MLPTNSNDGSEDASTFRHTMNQLSVFGARLRVTVLFMVGQNQSRRST